MELASSLRKSHRLQPPHVFLCFGSPPLTLCRPVSIQAAFKRVKTSSVVGQTLGGNSNGRDINVSTAGSGSAAVPLTSDQKTALAQLEGNPDISKV